MHFLFLRTRIRFWRDLHSHWIFKVLLMIWTILGAIEIFLPFWPAKWSEKFYGLKYLPQWPWYVWIFGFLVIIIIAIFEGGHRQVELKKRQDIIRPKVFLAFSFDGVTHSFSLKNHGDVPAFEVRFSSDDTKEYWVIQDRAINEIGSHGEVFFCGTGLRREDGTGRKTPIEGMPIQQMHLVLEKLGAIGQQFVIKVAYRDFEQSEYQDSFLVEEDEFHGISIKRLPKG